MILEDLNRIRNKWIYLRNRILNYPALSPQEKEIVKNGLLGLQNDVKSFISKYKDALMAAAIYDEAQRLLQSIHSLVSALRGFKYNELNSRLLNVDNNFGRLFGSVMERRNVLENVSTPQSKEETKATSPQKETKKEDTKEITLIERLKKGLQKIGGKSANSKNKKKEVKEEDKSKATSPQKETKEDKEEEDKEAKSIIRKIFVAPSIVFAILSIYFLYFYNAIFFIVFGLLSAVFYSIYKGKTAPLITWGFLIGIVGGAMYVWTYTGFSRYICLVTGYCPSSPSSSSLSSSSPDQNYIAQIWNSVSKVYKDMYMIMTNPEMYYLQQQAEAAPLQESYQYLLEINPPYSTAPVYYFLDKDNVNIQESIPLLYSIRSSLPADAGVIGITKYCIVIPRIDTSCIDPNSLANFGSFGNVTDYNGKVIGYINLEEDSTLPIYGLQNVVCKIPSFTLRLDTCGNLRDNRFYMDNKFILRLTNVTVTTYYKFLVTDVSLIVQAMKNNENVYDYLKLNSYEYDKGYFKGFVDFPKVDILRVGVLSKYPVIVFNKSKEIQDALYISLSNIEEIYNISEIKIDIIYNPNELNIITDYTVTSSFYNLTCNNSENRKLSCSITFGYYPGILGENVYLSEYKKESDRIIWFIPISIKAKSGFSEYSEVLIIANATYGLQKEVTNSVSYIPVSLQTNT